MRVVYSLLLFVTLLSCSEEPVVGTGETIPNFVKGSVEHGDLKVANAAVMLRQTAITQKGDSIILEYKTTCDEKGEYQFENVEEGSYTVVVDYQNLSAYKKEITFNGDSLNVEPLYLLQKVAIRGRIIDKVGQCNVSLYGTDEKAEVDEDGIYSFEAIPAGELALIYRDGAGKVATVGVSLVAKTEEITLYDVSLNSTEIFTEERSSLSDVTAINPVIYSDDEIPEWYEGKDFSGVTYTTNEDSVVNRNGMAKVAFTGALGYGANTTGGRGGETYVVTNLNNDGEGSLREAVEAEGVRTVIFNVSGEIALEKTINIRNPHITIAGQSSPEGITLTGYGLYVDTNDVIIRYLKIRPGTLSTSHGLWLREVKNVYIDHCSISWGTSDNVSIKNSENVTIANCIISEPLFKTDHYESGRSVSGYIEGKNISFEANLFSSYRYVTVSKNSENVDFRGNILFNWITDALWIADSSSLNVLSNYYMPGPATQEKRYNKFAILSDSITIVHIDGNIHSEVDSVTLNNNIGVHTGFPLTSFSPTLIGDVQPSLYSATALTTINLPHVGASKPERDAIDTRIVDEVTTGVCLYEDNSFLNDTNYTMLNSMLTSGIIDVPPQDIVQEGESRIVKDSDGDGISDDFEKANGLNLYNKSDAKSLRKDGFSWLEYYIDNL